MKEEKLIIRVVRHALHVVLEEALPTWEAQISYLDNQIQKLEEEQAQRMLDSPAEGPAELADEVDTLKFQNSSLETSLDRALAELRETQEHLSAESQQRITVEQRLDQLEQRVLTILKTK